jgi:large subunit ribosomal protein L20
MCVCGDVWKFVGFRGKAKNCFAIAKPRVMKALQHAYRDRKLKKQDFRGLWVQQINAGARQYGIGYSRLIHGLKEADIQVACSLALACCWITPRMQLNRRSLAELAQFEPDSFAATVRIAQDKLRDKWGNMHTPTQTLAFADTDGATK